MSYEFEEPAELSLIRQSVREFAEQEIAPKTMELDLNEQFSCELTEKMGEMGLLGTIVDPKYGGHGMDYPSYIVAVEEIARISASQAATIAAHNSLGAGPIHYYGTEEQKAEFLPELCTGKALWAFGQTEDNAGSDVQRCNTQAGFDQGSGEWVINGSKRFITNGSTEVTKGVTVLAVTGVRQDGKKEFTSFLVPIDTLGVSKTTMHHKMVWCSSNTTEYRFDNVRIPDRYRLGGRGQGFKISMETLDRGRLSIGAIGLGQAQGCLDLSLDYAKQRHQFDGPIINQQAIAFKLADMAIKVRAARLLLYEACWLCQNHKPFEMSSAMAKLFCSETAEFCAREGTQIHGGMGLMLESAIARHFLDVQLLRIGEGTDEVQRLVISRRLQSL